MADEAKTLYHKTEGVKNYEVWEGRHEFYRAGKLMVGPNKKNLIMTIVAI